MKIFIIALAIIAQSSFATSTIKGKKIAQYLQDNKLLDNYTLISCSDDSEENNIGKNFQLNVDQYGTLSLVEESVEAKLIYPFVSIKLEGSDDSQSSELSHKRTIIQTSLSLKKNTLTEKTYIRRSFLLGPTSFMTKARPHDYTKKSISFTNNGLILEMKSESKEYPSSQIKCEFLVQQR